MKLDDADWPLFGWTADMRPALAAARARGVAVVLGTLVRTVGSSPRPAGAQMLFDGRSATGYFSGGCLEADVANHAAAVLADRTPRRLVYGDGSPWIDIRLLCGGSLDIQLEWIAPNDAGVAALLDLAGQRRRVRWSSDGVTRRAWADDRPSPLVRDDAGYALTYDPPWRVVVVGGDPIALAIASLASTAGFEATIVRPFGPQSPPPLPGVDYARDGVAAAMTRLAPDPWTAVVTATHDDDIDDEAILAALAAEPAYVGALGSAARIPSRCERLTAAGLSPTRIASIHAPIGAARCGKAPWEVAVSVMAEIMQTRTDRATFARSGRDEVADRQNA